MVDEQLTTLINAIVDGDQHLAVQEARRLLSSGVSGERIVTGGIERAMGQLDNRCTAEQYNLLEIMLAGRAVDAVTRLLFPDGVDPEKAKAKVIVAALEGDVHDLGKNIVKKVLAGHGYYVIDCGKDVPLERLISTARQEGGVAICISGLITSVIPQVRQVRGLCREGGLGALRILAGGAALKQSTAGDLQVDYVGETAFDAVHYINQLVAKKGR